MQGRKEFTPQLFYDLSLDGLVPADNFYRKVNQDQDLGLHTVAPVLDTLLNHHNMKRVNAAVWHKPTNILRLRSA